MTSFEQYQQYTHHLSTRFKQNIKHYSPRINKELANELGI